MKRHVSQVFSLFLKQSLLLNVSWNKDLSTLHLDFNVKHINQFPSCNAYRGHLAQTAPSQLSGCSWDGKFWISPTRLLLGTYSQLLLLVLIIFCLLIIYICTIFPKIHLVEMEKWAWHSNESIYMLSYGVWCLYW